MVWSDYLPKKSLLVVGGGGEWQTKFSVSPGPGLWSLVLGPFGPDLGPDLDLSWDLDLDLSLTILKLEDVFYVLFDQDHTASHGAGLPLSDGVQTGPQHGRGAEGPGAGLPGLAVPAKLSPEEKEEISRD